MSKARRRRDKELQQKMHFWLTSRLSTPRRRRRLGGVVWRRRLGPTGRTRRNYRQNRPRDDDARPDPRDNCETAPRRRRASMPTTRRETRPTREASNAVTTHNAGPVEGDRTAGRANMFKVGMKDAPCKVERAQEGGHARRWWFGHGPARPGHLRAAGGAGHGRRVRRQERPAAGLRRAGRGGDGARLVPV